MVRPLRSVLIELFVQRKWWISDRNHYEAWSLIKATFLVWKKVEKCFSRKRTTWVKTSQGTRHFRGWFLRKLTQRFHQSAGLIRNLEGHFEVGQKIRHKSCISKASYLFYACLVAIRENQADFVKQPGCSNFGTKLEIKIRSFNFKPLSQKYANKVSKCSLWRKLPHCLNFES